MSLNTSPRMRLDSVIMAVSQLPFAATDCALPMIWARQNRVKASAVVTYTDNETWVGNIHPAQALRQYRDEFVGDAKAVVVGITSNGFTLADPNNRGGLLPSAALVRGPDRGQCPGPPERAGTSGAIETRLFLPGGGAAPVLAFSALGG